MNDNLRFQQAKKVLVGGVNSPVRSFKSVSGTPIFISRAKGPYLFGEDGKRYLDFCLSWGALILGHRHPAVEKALHQALKHGSNFGAPTTVETKLASLIRRAIPSMEKIRFTNSGTEAVMTAVRLARAFTGRKRIIQFAGAYHGHYDISADILPYNDLARLEKYMKHLGRQVAAVIVEPVMGNNGVILPHAGFLAGLRRLTKQYGALLIFDEVITGFRLCFGGAQNYFKIKPDLTTLGKIIGGGLPIGAVGGRREIMELLAPVGSVFQGGTFSGNLISMTAGLATLRQLKRLNPYRTLERKTQEVTQTILDSAKLVGAPLRINQIGSMFSFFFTEREVADSSSALTQDTARFKKFYHALLKQGIYLSSSPYEANFLSTAHCLHSRKIRI